MFKKWILIYCALLFLLVACQQPEQQSFDSAADDSLLTLIQLRLEEKKKLGELRLRMSESRLGKAMAKYKPIIKKYSKHYGFDWRLIAAQIVQESGFKPKARSRVGARGLMQLMPATAREISRELDIEYIMKNPRENITAGIYHLKKQYRLFPDADYANRIKLSLASYNSGVGRVFDAQEIARYYKQPTNVWPQVRPYISMLKKTDWQLHLQVWPNGRPRFGYFYGYNETLNYVDNIWTLYQAYQKVF